jgi:hypothetical protein
MSFTVPNFNLLCNVYDGPWSTKTARLLLLPCNLAMGRRVQQLGPSVLFAPEGAAAPNLLVPAFSDVRDSSCALFPDLIEVPAATGRWYQVNLVDDVGKGFPNEYRLVSMFKACAAQNPTEYAGLNWPNPIP